MDVAVFDCDDYTLTISTASIDYAWQRFARRVKDGALTYCDYISSREGTLSLCHPFDEDTYQLHVLNPEVPQTEWKEKHPVLFETCQYQFAIEFKQLESTENEKRNPKVHHPLRSVGESFRFYKSGAHSGILVGEIDFLNSPGKFKFSFEYRNGEGLPCRESFEAYVASPKLDTKNDLHEITSLINEEYENYVFDYLTLTFSSYSMVRAERNNSIVWLSIFKNVVDDYFSNVVYIMSRPNNRSVRRVYYLRPEKIRRWSPQQEERYKDYGQDADKHWFRCEQTENTTNTRENRFVKYTLRVLSKKFHEVFGEIGALYKDMDQEEIELLENYEKKFKQFLAAPFFKKVGDFEGFRQESAVLQQRTGYSQIYKGWLMLKNSLDLVDGQTDIGMKKIWELYEIWCFLIMKRLVAKVLGVDLHNQEEVQENKGEMLDLFSDSKLRHDITFYAHNGDVVKLEYQHTYNRRSKEMKTTTTEQRPDIVLEIVKKNNLNDNDKPFVLTYLYDAKYRVQDDTTQGDLDDGVDIDTADYPLPDAINQMHRYRDAIYYSMDDETRPRGKEVIGGYILFPGRTEGKKIENRYFYKSIKQVNIGAFPLLPADKDHRENLVQCDLLERHLREILLEDSIIEHVKDSIPQKGLTYTFAPEDESSIVLIGFCRTPLQWNKTKENKIYYVRLGAKGTLTLSPGFEYCKYLLMYTKEKKEIFKLKGNGPRIMTQADLVHLGFDPQSEIYLVYDLDESEPVTTFHGHQGESLRIKRGITPRKRDPYFTTLKELLEPED